MAEAGVRYQRVRLDSELEKERPVGVFRGVSLQGHPRPRWLVYYKSDYVFQSIACPNWLACWDALRAKQRAWNQAQKAQQGAPGAPGAKVKGGYAMFQHRLTFRAVNGILTGSLPGDLSAAVRAEADHRSMFAVEPVLHLASIQGKYGPWKDALFRAWQETPGAPSQGPLEHLEPPGADGLDSRASALFRVLSRAACLLHQVDYKVWDQHCGRHVAHHSGFLALLADLKVLSHGATGTQLRLSSARGAKVPMHELAATADIPRLSRYVLAAECLTRHLREPPRTFAEYVRNYAAYRAEVTQIRAPHNGGAYTVPWTWRSACLARMRALGVSRLLEAERVTVADFVAAFPDQNDWVETFKSYAAESVQHFMAELEFPEEPECLTLRLCINLEDEMALYCPRWLWHNRAVLLQHCHQFCRREGFFPHLGAMLANMRDQWRAQAHSLSMESLLLLEPLEPQEPPEPSEPSAPAAPAGSKRLQQGLPAAGPRRRRLRQKRPPAELFVPEPPPAPGWLRAGWRKLGPASRPARPPSRCSSPTSSESSELGPFSAGSLSSSFQSTIPDSPEAELSDPAEPASPARSEAGLAEPHWPAEGGHLPQAKDCPPGATGASRECWQGTAASRLGLQLKKCKGQLGGGLAAACQLCPSSLTLNCASEPAVESALQIVIPCHPGQRSQAELNFALAGGTWGAWRPEAQRAATEL